MGKERITRAVPIVGLGGSDSFGNSRLTRLAPIWMVWDGCAGSRALSHSAWAEWRCTPLDKCRVLAGPGPCFGLRRQKTGDFRSRRKLHFSTQRGRSGRAFRCHRLPPNTSHPAHNFWRPRFWRSRRSPRVEELSEVGASPLLFRLVVDL